MEITPENIKTFIKFELMMKNKKLSFKENYEYVDYALSILQSSFSTPFETFSSDLEGPFPHSLKKCNEKAKEMRMLGNMVFREDFFKAHAMYTLSIGLATTGSRELALAYGNRSAVLFEKQYYRECLEDIRRALTNNYPVENKAKLLQRETRAKDLLPSQKEKIFHEKVPKIKNKNPNMSAASNCIKMAKNDEYGRHIVATRTINPGEILVVEKPYAQFPFPENRTIYCSECLELCFNLIPCQKCSGVFYCSRPCRRKAFIDYHRFECPIMSHFGFDVIDWSATRITLKGIKEYQKEYTDPEVYCSDRYKEINELASGDNFGTDEKLPMTLGVAKVFYALKKFTDIFSEFDIENKENILKTLLLKDVLQWQCSVFFIKKYEHVNFGKAIYSTTSLFDHACNENVGYSFYGSLIVLRATKKIQKGEQCFVNYGVSPLSQSKEQRQNITQNEFNFTCKCKACLECWPKAEALSAEARSLTIELSTIQMEIMSRDEIDKHRKTSLLQRCCKILEKLEAEAPFLSYVYSKDILDKILLEGNTFVTF